jgi:methionine sulfoxide reductase heme-binding subunit
MVWGRALLHPAAKPLVFLLSLLPFGWLLYGAITGNLGANPAEYLIRSTGDWTLRFLCLTLAVTPLRVMAGLPTLARFRRMLGLFTYFYVVLHMLTWSWFDQGFDVAEMAKDIAKRPFILVGFTAFVLLTPLAATSFNRAVKAMGAKRWQALHKLVYVVAPLAILHFFWMRAGKNDFAEVAVYAAILAVLLGWRLWNRRRTVGTSAHPTGITGAGCFVGWALVPTIPAASYFSSNTRQVVVACAYSVPSGPTSFASAVASWRPQCSTRPSARTRCTRAGMPLTRFTPSSAVV